jgi:hypothetical protein
LGGNQKGPANHDRIEASSRSEAVAIETQRLQKAAVKKNASTA